MNISVSGNREGWTYQEVEDKLNELGVYHSDILITGGAEGVDTFTQQYAKKYGNICIIIYPKPSTPSPQRYFNRNFEVVCRGDVLVAFNLEEHSGTTNAINHAHQLQRPIIEIKKGEKNASIKR